MHAASWRGHIECMNMLLDKGADINTVDKHNRTSFFFACLAKTEEPSRLLLDKLIEKGVGASEINITTKRGRTSLRQAAAKGFLSVVKSLLDLGLTPEMINAVDTVKGRNALHYAAFNGQIEVLKVLLEKGADASIKDKDGKSVINLCAEQWAFRGSKTFEDVASILIDLDPETARQDPQLLSSAAANGSKLILEKLHKAKADLTRPDRYGWTPLLLAKRFQQKDATDFLDRQIGSTNARPTKFETSSKDLIISEDSLTLTFKSDGK